MSKPLHNKVALVTGGGRGIGRGIALALADMGADVAVISRTADEINAVAEEIRQLGRRAAAPIADISNHDNIRRAVQTVTEELGPIDILVNNAGVTGPLNVLENTDPAEWAFVQQVNVVAPYGFIREILPGMKSRGYGRIINISSGAGRDNGKPRMGAYSVSKAALDMLSRNTGIEVDGTGITVNSVRPGVVNTDMIAYIRSKPRENIRAMQERFERMDNDNELANPERVGWLIAAVTLTDKNAQILDVRPDGEFLTSVLAEHGLKPTISGR